VEQLISEVCTSGLIVITLLIITRRISLKDAGKVILKGILAVVLILTLICVLKGPLAAALAIGLAALKSCIAWLSLIVLVLLLIRVMWGPQVGKCVKTSGRRFNHGGGDL
jgi:uncharacterized membrane protein